MAIEIVDLPIKKVIFHSYGNVYQRVLQSESTMYRLCIPRVSGGQSVRSNSVEEIYAVEWSTNQEGLALMTTKNTIIMI